VCILFIVLQSHVIIKALFVTHFKICLQYDFIWWVLPPVGAAIGVLGVAVWGGGGDRFATTKHPSYMLAFNYIQ
jgi:hypothetical protein